MIYQAYGELIGGLFFCSVVILFFLLWFIFEKVLPVVVRALVVLARLVWRGMKAFWRWQSRLRWWRWLLTRFSSVAGGL